MATPSLTILHDAEDLRCVETLDPRALDGAVVAFDLDLHLALLDRGIDHVTPWDFIAPSERPQLASFEERVQSFWSAHARVTYAGIDLLGLARHRHVTCLRRFAWAAFVARRAIERYAPREVVVLEERSGHGLEQPAGHARMPMLSCLVHAAAETRGVSVRLLDRTAVPGAAGFVDEAARAASEVTRGDLDPEPPLDDPWVLLLGHGEDLRRQLPLVRGLRARGLAVVQCYRAASAEVLAEVAAVGHRVCHERALAPPQDPGDMAPAADAARAAVDAAARAADADLRAVFAHDAPAVHLDFIFGPYARAMAGHVATWDALLARRPPSVLVATSPLPAADIASLRGIEVVHLGHAITMLDHPEMHAAMPGGTIGAVSPAHAERLRAAGVAAPRVHVTGDPGVDHLTTGRQRDPAPPRARRLLLLTNTMAMPATTGTLPRADWRRQAETALAVGRLLAARPTWRVALRRHPRFDHPRLFDRVVAAHDLGGRFRTEDDRPLADSVHDADVVVAVDAIGSALIEASWCGRPVVILDTALVWFDHHRSRTDRWPRVKSVADLGQELDVLLADVLAWNAAVTRTRAAADHHLGGAPAAAVPRCVDLIEAHVPSTPRTPVTSAAILVPSTPR